MKPANDENMNPEGIEEELLNEVNGGLKRTVGGGNTKLVCSKCGNKIVIQKRMADAFIARQKGKCMCGGMLLKTEATSIADAWLF